MIHITINDFTAQLEASIEHLAQHRDVLRGRVEQLRADDLGTEAMRIGQQQQQAVQSLINRTTAMLDPLRELALMHRGIAVTVPPLLNDE
jgi:hypothetical protein